MSKSALEVELEWEEGFRFAVRSAERSSVIDGKRNAAPAPTDMLLAAVGACAGIDMVDILEKGRAEVRGLTVSVSGTRRPDPPRFFESLHARFVVHGEVSEAKANRAADLSFQKYCSVYHTLRKDLATTWEVVVEP
jgi:putative redox protein